MGLWGLVGSPGDKGTAFFSRTRQVELKRGRIGMLTTMVYITPELTGKLGGYLSPYTDLKFEDIRMVWQPYPRSCRLGGPDRSLLCYVGRGTKIQPPPKDGTGGLKT